MSARRFLTCLILAAAPLAGQPADSSATRHPIASWDAFPLWTAPGEANHYIAPDSLVLTWPQGEKADRPLLRAPHWLGLGAAAVLGALSYTYTRQADAAYLAYQTSGDPSQLDALFRETERLDRLAGWFYAGAEAGLVLVGISLALHP